MNEIVCSEHETATTRGRIPAHDVYPMQKTLLDLLVNKRRKQLLNRLMAGKVKKNRKSNKASIEFDLFELFNYHYYSYDKNKRPNKE